MSDTNREHVLQNDNDICLLNCTNAFNNLSDREKAFAHHISRASWIGGLIVLTQTSPESPGIFLLLQKLFRNQSIDCLKEEALKIGLSEDDFQAILIYAAGFYNNMGNYKSFGDRKFIPNLSKETFEKFILHCANNVLSNGQQVITLWRNVGDAIYNVSQTCRQLGFSNQGTTTYYSSNCCIEDASCMQKFLNSKDLLAYNTRVFKRKDPESGMIKYEIRLASSNTESGALPGCNVCAFDTETFTPQDSSEEFLVQITRGDYAELMGLMVESLENAKNFVARDVETNMLDEYIKSFKTGSIHSHKEGSRLWIRNISPVVEMYIGFIESYRDPYGVRGEFEGFVAVVNKEMSAKFARLVDNAPDLLPYLPWPPAYEKDEFLRPDFTSLDVLTFGGSGIPAGINIPNYDDIRQNEGFKNVSLGNVISAGYQDQKATFLREEDKQMYSTLKIPSFEVQVGLHELLGHGSGKLFIQKEDGSFNFDIENVLHTETSSQIESWYQHNQTWDGKFSTLASTYEECRAECVGLYLSLLPRVLSIFGHSGQDADDIIYINWLNMVRSGLMSLEYYSPESRRWGQAHMHARFVILRVLLESDKEFVKIQSVTGADGKPDLAILLDRSKIQTVGKQAIGNFLRKLQVYKSTGDYDAGKAMYEHYADVSDFLSLRDIVLDRKLPRKLYAQHNTVMEDGHVSLQTYTANASGVIKSFLDRFSEEFEPIIERMWQQDSEHFDL